MKFSTIYFGSTSHYKSFRFFELLFPNIRLMLIAALKTVDGIIALATFGIVFPTLELRFLFWESEFRYKRSKAKKLGPT